MDVKALEKCANAVFADDDLTTVLAVKWFAAGEHLVVDEVVAGYTPSAPIDLHLVKLIVGPGNPGPADQPSTSPGIGIEIWLPTKEGWNGRIHNVGGLGGFDGGEHTSPDRVGWFYAALAAGAQGAVSASTDAGHSPTDGSWAMNPDGSHATQLWTDFSHRAHHEMAVKTKALTEAYYGRPAEYCYYEGASTGGRHGYRLAQQYPDDYDGIIALLPAMNFAKWGLAALHRELVIERDLDGVPLTEEQMDLISNAAIAAGDVVGGEHFGYVFDNPANHYDPTKDPSVLCPSDGGESTSPHCVTLAQATAINKLWYGATDDGSVPDPAVDNGCGVDLGDRRWYGLSRGTSLYIAYFTKQDPRMRDILRAASESGNVPGADFAALVLGDPSVAGPSFENALRNGEAKWRDLSYGELGALFDKAAEREPVFAHIASDDPDLSAFKARGGKFLSWHGWNDETIPVQTTMRYYDRVIEAMGGVAEVQSFFKLYLVPGGGHMSPQGTSNEDANPPVFAPGQFFGLLVDWVERGIEPHAIEVTSPGPDSPITQPMYPYPSRAVYVEGDPRAASSYAEG